MVTTSAQETRDRIIRTAERLFAERGFVATSLRDLTTEAGVNVAAVNYHFGSKENLLRSVIREVLASVNKQRHQNLEMLMSDADSPSVEALLEAFAFPVFDLFGNERGRVLARLLSRTLGEPHEDIRHIVIEEVEAVEHVYLEAFQQALPHLSRDELWWRFRSTIGVLVAQLSGLLTNPQALHQVDYKHSSRAWTITFLAAALRAPATPL